MASRKSAMEERENRKETQESIESTLEKIRQEITVASKIQKPEAYLTRIEKTLEKIRTEETPKDFPRVHAAVEKEIRAAMRKLEREVKG